jgi:hypothetical protein
MGPGASISSPNRTPGIPGRAGIPVNSHDRATTVTAADTRGKTAWWCVLTASCLVLAAPLTLVNVPPLLDYPNHLARLFVLAFVAADPVLARFYQPHWGIIPNLGLDLTVPPLLWIFPIHLAGRAAIGVTLLLPVFGAAAYHRALTGRQSYWPLGAVLFAYNALLLRGFLNFIASVGLALLLAAGWIAWRERRPFIAIMVAAMGAVVLFFCHLTGLVLFAVLIGAHELMMLRTSALTAGWIARRAAAVLVVFAMPALLYAASELGAMRGDAEFRSAAEKAHAALTPVINYLWPLDLATAVFCVAVPALCLARRWCVVRFQAPLAIAVLALLFIGSPVAFKGTYDLDTRFIVMLAFVAPAAIVPVALPRRAAWTIGMVFVLLFGARMTVLMTVWNAWSGDVIAFRSVIATVQPGDVVLTVRSPHGNSPDLPLWTARPERLSDGSVTDTHLPALLLIEHRAWWPFLFDNLSQQPIETREPFRTLADTVDSTADPIGLLSRDAPEMRPVTHVLVLHPESAGIASSRLRLVAGNGEAALYEVRR